MPFWGALICLAGFILLLSLVVSLMLLFAEPVDDAPHQLTDADPYLAEMSRRVLAADTQARREARDFAPFHSEGN